MVVELNTLGRGAGRSRRGGGRKVLKDMGNLFLLNSRFAKIYDYFPVNESAQAKVFYFSWYISLCPIQTFLDRQKLPDVRQAMVHELMFLCINYLFFQLCI